MRLLILTDVHVLKAHGKYWAKDPWLKVAGHLRPFFSSVTVCAPLIAPGDSSKEYFDVKRATEVADANGPSVRWVHTHPHYTVMNYYKSLPFLLKKNFPVLAEAIRDCDLVFMRLPAMNGFVASILAYQYGRPIFGYFSGDQLVEIRSGGKYRGLQAIAARAIARLHEYLHSKLIRFSEASFFEAAESLGRFRNIGDKCCFLFPSTVETHEISERTGSKRDKPSRKLLFVGRLSPEKGIIYLLQALKLLVLGDLSFRLTICGTGPERASLESLAAQLEVNRHIEFLGHVPWGPDLHRVYRDHDVFVLPSLSEGVPKVVLEAMANGLPVISTNLGGMKQIITDGENGILVQAASGKAICDAVTRLTADATTRERLIERGYGFIREHTADRQAEKIARAMISRVRPNLP